MIDEETTDPLTGLPSRESMMQAVAQAEFDRERFAVAVLDVRGFARFNRRYGMVVGDELLCVIGRALLLHTATGTEACRLGGDRFAILAVEPDCSTRWVAPIITAVRAAIEQWAKQQHPRTAAGQPEMTVGVAEGWTAEVWTNAEIALQTAKDDRLPVVDYRAVDSMTRRRLRAGPVVEPVPPPRAESEPLLIEQQIDPVGRPEPAWLWLRLSAGLTVGGETRDVERLDTADGQPQLVEQWIIEQACRRLAKADRQMRISVPVSAEAARARSLAQHLFPLIERHRVPPSRLVFEIAYETMAAADRDFAGRPGDPVARFIHEIAGLGSSVVVTGFAGGWMAWTRLRALEVSYLRPAVDLIQAAARGDSVALRSLSSMAANADDSGQELIAPWIAVEHGTVPLAELGFAYQEGPETQSTTGRPLRQSKGRRVTTRGTSTSAEL